MRAGREQLSLATRPNDGGTLLKVPPGRGELQIQYTALSLQVPEKVRFKYRLEPRDADWVDAGAERSVSYNNLPAGSYRFLVIACNNDGVWNETGASLAIHTVVGNLLTPWLTSRTSHMSPVAVFVSVLVWGWLWGLWGLLLGIPVMMAVKAVCDRVEDLKAVGELLGD